MADIDLSGLPPPPADADAPAPPAEPDLSGLPPPPEPTQTLGGFTQALGTVPLNVTADLASLPTETVGKARNLGIAAGGAAEGAYHALTDKESLLPGETLTEDGRAGVTKDGIYHYIDKDGNEVTGKSKPPEGAKPFTVKPNHDLPQVEDVEALPGSRENIARGLRNLAGSNLVDIKEATKLNEYAQILARGGVEGLMGAGPTSVVRSTIAGAAAGGASKAAADAGYDESGQVAASLIAGYGASKFGTGPKVSVGPNPQRPSAYAYENPRPTIEQILDTPDTEHEGSGRLPGPEPAPAAPAAGESAPAAKTGVPATTDANTTRTYSYTDSKGVQVTAEAKTGALGSAIGDAVDAGADLQEAEKIGRAVRAGEITADEGRAKLTALVPKSSQTVATPKAPTTTPAEDAEPPMLGSPDHPMRNGQPYTMVSGELSTLPHGGIENQKRHDAMGAALRATGLRVEPTIGEFEGGPERSYAVQTPTPEDRAKVEAVAKGAQQKSVLHVDADKNGTFRHSDPDTPDEQPGKMVRVSKDEALGAPGWTRDADGNYYTIKSPEEAPTVEPPPGKNGLGDNPVEDGYKTIFGPAHKVGSTEAEPTAEGQAQRVQDMKDVGVDEAPKSAITGDYRAAGTEHQTSKVDGPVGDRLSQVFDANRQAVRNHADSLIDMTGGTRGLGPEMYPRGQAIEAPIRGLADHLEQSMNNIYNEAKQRGQGKLVPLTSLHDALNNNRSAFQLSTDGEQLHKSIMTRMDELGLTDKNGAPKPATPEQAEALRKHISDGWTPQRGKLVGALKGNIDADVGKALGEDLFAKGRGVRTQIAAILEEPEGVSKLLHTKEANKLGVNRQINLEDIPGYVKNLPADQFRHVVAVTKLAAQSGVPKLREQAVKALGEIRAQFANEYLAAADNQKGAWNQKGGNTYLKGNELNMRHVFTPQEMEQFAKNDRVGRYLSRDMSYPGAEAQKQNLASKAAQLAGKAMSHGVAAGGAALAGSLLGHGEAAAGAVGGQLAGAAAERLGNRVASKQADQLIQKLDEWKPESTGATPAPKGPPGQRGSFSFQNDNPINRATSAPRNKQSGGSVTGVTERNPRSEYNANSQIAGRPKMTAEQNDILRRLSGQGGAVGDLGKQSTAGLRNKQGGGPRKQGGFVGSAPATTAPKVPLGQPSPRVRAVAERYMKDAGLPYERPGPTQVDPERAKRIAAAYDAMEHNPNDPKVKASYDAMIKETAAQYQAMKKSGLKVEFFPSDGKDPYNGNPRAAIDDIQQNNHLYVYPTKAGFGGGAEPEPKDNPLLGDSGEKFGGQPATHNDIFRAVHDYFGHGQEGNGFRANGEENAWRQHAAMYSDKARPAMTSETRGQNSWVNYGPHGDVNRTAKQEDTTYAEQKTGLLPKEFSDPKNVGKAEQLAPEDHPDWIPQRLVTSKKAEAADSAARPTVDLKTFKSTPALFDKNMDVVRDYPNVTEKQSTEPADKLANDFIKHAKDNILALHDEVPEATRERSAKWYDGANKIAKDFAAKYGITDSHAAGVLAALSPQKDWYQNVSLAQRVLDINKGGEKFYNGQPFDDKMTDAFMARPALKEYKSVVDLLKGRSLSDLDKHPDLTPEARITAKTLWTRLYDEAHNDRGHRLVTPEGGFGDYVKKADGGNSGTGWKSLSEIAKAIKVLESDGSANAISPLMGDMHKVRNFYNNILSPNSAHGDVTIDTHAVAAGLMRPLSGTSTEVAHNFGSSPGKGIKGAGGSAITGIQGTYPLYAEAYRQAAKERGILPRQMQSIAWEAVRGLFPDTFKTAANSAAIDAIWKDYRAGKITQQQARSKVYEKAGGIRPPSWEGALGSDESGGDRKDSK